MEDHKTLGSFLGDQSIYYLAGSVEGVSVEKIRSPQNAGEEFIHSGEATNCGKAWGSVLSQNRVIHHTHLCVQESKICLAA